MKKGRKQKKFLLIAGLICIAIAIATTVLIFSFRFEKLWIWYADIVEVLDGLKNRISSIDNVWRFTGAILGLFLIKAIFPIYPTSTVCFLTGAFFPMYFAVPLNIVGLIVQFSVKYFWGKKFGAPYAWKWMKKNEGLRHAIQQKGKGNTALLFALRLVPSVPVNGFSALYGSFSYGYLKFILVSVAGFMPKLLIFAIVGRNLYDPLSPGFLIPIIILSLFTGLTFLSVNGAWTVVEKIVNYIINRKKLQLPKGGKSNA